MRGICADNTASSVMISTYLEVLNYCSMLKMDEQFMDQNNAYSLSQHACKRELSWKYSIYSPSPPHKRS
ncbi:hypothetical protein P5673_004037 [Acropora cervicornis]|uniref:Uncharacterized protein n=1 Tax=Acropora cervicornis TaxID=6130 RepID=A0AAD9VEW6_ACRCE|nr:hypothetical protein P5673_004037 [Acropora cervicornis]